MATEIEAKTDAALEAKPEARPETKAELPFVSLLDSLAAAETAPAAESAAPTAVSSAAKAAKADLPEAEPLKPDFGDQTLRLAIEMAAARPADKTRRKFSLPVPAAATRSSWRTPLAAALVLAAVGGAAFGSLSGATLGYLWFGSGGSNKIEANALQTMKAELAQL